MDKPNWAMIDRHATETPAKSAHLIHDLNKSAGLLCYELCKEQGMGSPELDRLVHLTTWRTCFWRTTRFHAGQRLRQPRQGVPVLERALADPGRIEALLDHPLLEVMAVKRRIENPLGFAWSRENVSQISPTVGCVDTIIGNNNLIVHQLLKQKASPYPVLLTLFRRPRAWSRETAQPQWRSVKVAEKLQGGATQMPAPPLCPR